MKLPRVESVLEYLIYWYPRLNEIPPLEALKLYSLSRWLYSRMDQLDGVNPELLERLVEVFDPDPADWWKR